MEVAVTFSTKSIVNDLLQFNIAYGSISIDYE